jgi:hypothetical protein
LALFLFPAASITGAEGPTATIQTSDGQRHAGRVVGDAASVFRFVGDKGGPTLPLDRAGVVSFEGATALPQSPPPFQVALGHQQWVSGRLSLVSDKDVKLDAGPGGRPVVAARSGVLAVRQRPGEAVVLADGFESLDESRRSKTGEVSLDEKAPREGKTCLSLSAQGASVEYRLPMLLSAGRLEVAFQVDGRQVAGRRKFVELVFTSSGGAIEPVRVVLGWSEESPIVETPQGPALAVQRLRPGRGWHTLTVRFDSDQLDLAIDGDSLAHGKSQSSGLTGLRLVCEPRSNEPGPADLTARFDDLKLTRFVQPFRSFEVDPTQDEVRLVSGDQLFGKVIGADASAVVIEMLDQPVRCEWPEVMALNFRRRPEPARPVAGQQVRLEWGVGPTRDYDAAEGVLSAANEREFVLKTPNAGDLFVPLARMRRLVPLGRSLRLVIDPTAHHLGDQYMPKFDPPQHEGGLLERKFTLESVPSEAANVVLDVVEVIGVADNLLYQEEIKGGNLRTNVVVNGRLVDYVNRHVHDLNETAERVRLSVPAGLLKAGENTLRIELVGKKNEPGFLDDMGVLGIAVEFAMPPGGGPAP